MDKTGIFFIIWAIIFNALGNILIKTGMINQENLFKQGSIKAFFLIITNPFAFLGIASFGIAFVLYGGVLSKLDLSIAYPIMTGMGFLLVLLAAIFFFQESINLFRVLGIVAILFGVTVISIKG